jgi:hypothetical protein
MENDVSLPFAQMPVTGPYRELYYHKPMSSHLISFRSILTLTPSSTAGSYKGSPSLFQVLHPKPCVQFLYIPCMPQVLPKFCDSAWFVMYKVHDESKTLNPWGWWRYSIWKFGNHLSSDAASLTRRPLCSELKYINTSELKSDIYWSFPWISVASWRLQPRNTSVCMHPCLQNKCYFYLIRDIRYMKDKRNIIAFRKSRKAVTLLKTRFISESTNNTVYSYLFVQS